MNKKKLIREPCQSQDRGTCEPTEIGIIEFLWQLLDDIDTVSDMVKSDDAAYRKMVEKIQKRRWETGIDCDGYKLDINSALIEKTNIEDWIIWRWKEEVSRRPARNIHYKTLDNTWKQIYRHITGKELSIGDTKGAVPDGESGQGPLERIR